MDKDKNMNVLRQEWNGWHILVIEDEFVVRHLVEVRRILEELGKGDPPRIALDLTATTYIDSSAITLMLNYQKRLNKTGGKLVVFGANEDTQSIFSIVGLDDSVNVYETRRQFEQTVG